MKLSEYIHTRGLYESHVAKKMGVTRQQLDQYGRSSKRFMSLRTAQRIAEAMTELGAPTTIAELTMAIMYDSVGEGNAKPKPIIPVGEE